MNEDQIADAKLVDASQHDSATGRYISIGAGRRKFASDEDVKGVTSGGLTTWLTQELMTHGLVDGVIQVGESQDSGRPMFSYQISESAEEVRAARKSRYYPVNFADSMASVRGNGKTYAFVGVPCQVRAARLVCEEDVVLREQIVYFVGIVCGHMKSAAYAESLAWQVGVPPSELDTVDFRIKRQGTNAREYQFGAKAVRSGEMRVADTGSLVGGSWGHAVFQLGACDYCDDIFAETADVVFGDAWLQQYERDWRGTNIVITRNLEIDRILKDGVARSEIELDGLTPAQAASSQAGNFRHRRQGLAVRLADDLAAGRWAPRKRVAPDVNAAPPRRVALIRARREISRVSHDLFAQAVDSGSLALYIERIRPYIARHDRYARSPWSKLRTLRQLGFRRSFSRIVGRVAKMVSARV
ncbi:Coenzyme F420 hydrogenase/dehydrogenase, beta subunit C-terminal domain [Cellulomonas phragmiteti]|uniref:Coenzyme F420 hydrogenase n=1 Tax=Cellulomonas phragmiteti TaxID=478780 RepID=A0ABQ4DHH7_9CELL|nr:Coenzyme F420 hydrogenase/dehydrogenase, beta subunit C-terminal domain [Cellulomonas phragmiteti]GIG38795.1 coenzyme F420 hydrogenase [Cellulomonas phragmiteti]